MNKICKEHFVFTGLLLFVVSSRLVNGFSVGDESEITSNK